MRIVTIPKCYFNSEYDKNFLLYDCMTINRNLKFLFYYKGYFIYYYREFDTESYKDVIENYIKNDINK